MPEHRKAFDLRGKKMQQLCFRGCLTAMAALPNICSLTHIPAEAMSMAEWQAIETAPENKDILVYRDLSGGDYGVDKCGGELRAV